MGLKIAILGGSGYIGGEALRLLLAHSQVTVSAVTANEHAGKSLAEVHPNLRGVTDLSFVGIADLPPCEAYLLSLPHGEAAQIVPRLPQQAKMVDLSGDFRLKESSLYERYYKIHHPAPHLLKDFVYGIPEIARGRIREATKVAVGGCFATATILALHPLIPYLEGPVVVDGKTGSSGSGAKPTERTHHPFRSSSLFAYEPFHHRHVPEIVAALGGKVDLFFQPHSAPMVRGVFISAYATVTKTFTDTDLRDLYSKAYSGERFVRLIKDSPNVNWVKGSNYIDIGFSVDGRRVVVWSALDNLIKGGAGQGIQCLNLMCGFPEEMGLALVPAHP